MRWLPRSVLLVLSATVALAGCSGRAVEETADPPAPALEPSEPFTTSAVTLRGPDGEAVEVPVYVAATGEQRAFGLMERDELPAGTGMLFAYPGETSGAYYMYRTRIPLSIAFHDDQGRILAVLDMEPCTSEDSAACERYDPGVPYRGALEVNQGFLADHGVGQGWTIDLPEDLPAPS